MAPRTRKSPASRKALSKFQRTAVFIRNGRCCWYCGCGLWHDSFHIDHKLSVQQGGTCELWNLVPACEVCNVSKSSCTINEHRRVVAEKFVRRLNAFMDSLTGMADQYSETKTLRTACRDLMERVLRTPPEFPGEIRERAEYHI